MSQRSRAPLVIACLLGVSCADEPAPEPLCFDREVELIASLKDLSAPSMSEERLKALDEAQLQALLVDRSLTCVEPEKVSACHELYLTSWSDPSGLSQESTRAPWRFAVNLRPLTDVVSVCDLPEEGGDCYDSGDCQEGERCLGLSALFESEVFTRAAELMCEGRESCARCLTRCINDEACGEGERCSQGLDESGVCLPSPD